MSYISFKHLATGLVALPIIAMSLSAAPALADQNDPGVARVSTLQGEIDVQRGDSGSEVAAAVNAPLMAGDYLTSQDASQAEVQLDYGNVLRVSPDAQLRFTQLDPPTHAIQLADGTIEARVFARTDAQTEIDTPSITIRAANVGRYRVTVTSDGNTIVTVRSGRADIVTPQGEQDLVAGSSLYASGDAANPTISTDVPVAYDAFDRWNDARDRSYDNAVAYENVSTGVVGANDLDRYGQWVDVNGYGNVWQPNVAPGWAPYQDGSWVWENYYGWTWVSAEPWGWAPYHYGRWLYANGVGWCWYPQPAVVQPVWQPALVAFFSFGGGNIGWIPLGPRDPFHPWWGGNAYASTTVVNVTNVNITNVYVNASAPNAIVGVDRRSFQAGQFKNRTIYAPAELTAVAPIRGVIPVVPSAANLHFTTARSVGVSHVIDRRFEAFKVPAPVVKPFAVQREAVSTTVERRYPLSAPVGKPAVDAVEPVVVPKPAPIKPAAPDARDPFDRGTPARAPETALPPEPPAVTVPARPPVNSTLERPKLDGTQTMGSPYRAPVHATTFHPAPVVRAHAAPKPTPHAPPKHD